MERQDSTPPARWNEESSRQFIDRGRYFVPQRARQMQVIASLLPVAGTDVILELCCGEGFLAEELLTRNPQATLYGLDGSEKMLARARTRLARFGERFQARRFDLGARDWRNPDFSIRAVVSSLAIHHLTGEEKQELFGDIYRFLSPGGALVIADLVQPAHDAGRHLAAVMWDEVVRQQALDLDGHTGAFDSFSKVRWNSFRYPDPDDFDRPSLLFEQLKWLERAGFVDVDVYWMLAGHAIFGARKPENTDL